MEGTDNLRELYEDKDGFRKEEISEISGPNDFTEFYNRLKNIKEFHRKHPNQVIVFYYCPLNRIEYHLPYLQTTIFGILGQRTNVH